MILGDLNSDFGTINGRKLSEFCSVLNLTYRVTEQTRITRTSRSYLDQNLSNFRNFLKNTEVEMPVSNNDHCTVGIRLNF